MGGHFWRAVKDYECDGEHDYCNLHLAAGHDLGIESVAPDRDCNDEPDDSCVEYDYDEDRRELVTRSDLRCVGIFDECEVTRYDAAGRVVSVRRDAGCDETVDYVELTDYHDGTQSQETTIDSDGDGAVDHCRVTVQRLDGRAIVAGDDANCDGLPEADCVSDLLSETADFSLHGRDSDCDGIPESRCTRVDVDDAGRVVRSSTDPECSGQLTKCREFDYCGDALCGVRVDQDCDGDADGCHEYGY